MGVGTGISPGQKLTPNQNVRAVAGTGGDVWGAAGGGAAAIGGGAVDQTGYAKPFAATMSDAERATNFIEVVEVAKGSASVLGKLSVGRFLMTTPDLLISDQGNNIG